MTTLTCFKAYDIRGRLYEELNTEIAYRIGRAYAQFLNARKIAIGGDIRSTSEELKEALANGIMDAGCDVIDLGMTGTEHVYFASFHMDVDGGIEVTASHNPIDFNGMKLVKRNAQPVSGDSGLKDIQKIAESSSFKNIKNRGTLTKLDLMDDYINHILSYIRLENIKPIKLVVNAGNGSAGPTLDALEEMFHRKKIPVEFVKIHHTPDPTFPNGIPNPLLPENRSATSDAVRTYKADIGVAWDGDFDRCFLFDENGDFIEGYYIVGLLAEAFLKKKSGEKIIHDPRLTWNTIDIVEKNNGICIQSKTGHAFIKERMRLENAVYGGEMSAHHYFRDFSYCDSGMIPWLLIIELISVTNTPLSSMVRERMQAFPCSGEINFKVHNTDSVINAVKSHYKYLNPVEDYTDGLSLEFDSWRLNIRSSNTEPLLRLNVESKNNDQLVKDAVHTIKRIIKNCM
ncbi:phosphomannomutase CpsG [Venatoribacter cucullus]|uniref:phosphomannomutase n=1 Tax=Venatoribacter cucullus TaxID=2661630 RepID=A0A9X7YNW2_9GAMM|nr:phosphomannomutase CpsG [Venatoribacter cucullus]QQD25170.1 phosphomannomutase CpsG [Venatoribacter cucullus]